MSAGGARFLRDPSGRAVQPIPFPHKTHIAKKAVCADCHGERRQVDRRGHPEREDLQ